MKPDSCIMIIRNLIALATVVVALTNLNGCSDPTKPKDVKYNLYVGATHLASSEEDSSFNRIYIYDADSLTLLDSIWQAHFTENLAASPDGRWLYVLDFTTQSVPRMLWKLDVRTKRVLWSRSDFGGGGGRARIHLLQDGAILLVGNTIVTPEDGTAVRTFTDSLFTMWGPVSGTKVAVIVRGQPLWHGNDSLLRVLDAATGELSGGYVAHLSTGEVLRALASTGASTTRGL
ncbi:MAG: hypothetical protein HZB43_08435 [candidate division Zixibacteria bacterium]|nr:hypothetical protein [candidate division Zixibacteria bacterium]